MRIAAAPCARGAVPCRSRRLGGRGVQERKRIKPVASVGLERLFNLHENERSSPSSELHLQ